jgi:hypothetical protein
MNKDALLLDDWEKKRQKSKSSNCKDWDGFSSLSLRAFGPRNLMKITQR